MTGRMWAYVGAGLGGVVSIAANVAHSYVPPADAGADWSPQTGAVVGAVFWPVSLFVAVEILARITWPAGRRWTLLRFGGLLPVAVVAAVVSYKHLAGLLAFYGEDTLTATIGPLAVDGLMVMATGALLATGAGRAATATPGPATESAPVTVTPAEPATAAPVDATPTATPPTEPARPRVVRRPASAEKVAKAATKMPGATVAAIAAKAGVSESTARRYLPAAQPVPAATVASPTELRPAETPALADAA
jgi:hypothetical protein